MTGRMSATHLRPPSCITALHNMYPCLYICPCQIPNLSFSSCIVIRVSNYYPYSFTFVAFLRCKYISTRSYSIFSFRRGSSQFHGRYNCILVPLYTSNVTCTQSVSSLLNILSDSSVFRFDRSGQIYQHYAAYNISLPHCACTYILLLSGQFW